MARTVRIVGHEDPWEVICETPTSMVLVNRNARRRDEIATLEAKLAELREQFAARSADASVDVAGHVLHGP